MSLNKAPHQEGVNQTLKGNRMWMYRRGSGGSGRCPMMRLSRFPEEVS